MLSLLIIYAVIAAVVAWCLILDEHISFPVALALAVIWPIGFVKESNSD